MSSPAVSKVLESGDRRNYEPHGFTEFTVRKSEFQLSDGTVIDAQLNMAVYGADNPSDWRTKGIVVFHPPIALSNRLGIDKTSKGFQHGWGKHLIGPGNLLDTDKYIIVVPETLGGRAIEGRDCSTTAALIIGRYGYNTALSLEDTSNLTARVLHEDFKLNEISAAAGISLGSHIAYKWLTRTDIQVSRIIDICGGEVLSPATREYLEIITSILDPSANHNALRQRLKTCLAGFKSKEITEIGEHLEKDLRVLVSHYDSSKAVALAHKISYIFYHSPNHFDSSHHAPFYNAQMHNLDLAAKKHTERRNAASDRLQNAMMLLNEPDAIQIATDLQRHEAKILSVSIGNDLLFPADIQAAHLAAIRQRCPGKVSHTILPPSPTGHCSFLHRHFKELTFR